VYFLLFVLTYLYQCKGLPGKTCLQYDLLCLPCSFIHSVYQILAKLWVEPKTAQFIIAITLSTVNQFSLFLAHTSIHCRKFVTGGYIVGPPKTVCVTTLPCKILIMSVYMFTYIHCSKKLPIYFATNCHFLTKIS